MCWYARHSTVPAFSCAPHTPHSSHALAVLAGLKLGLQLLHAVALNLLDGNPPRACSQRAVYCLLRGWDDPLLAPTVARGGADAEWATLATALFSDPERLVAALTASVDSLAARDTASAQVKGQLGINATFLSSDMYCGTFLSWGRGAR